MGYGMDFVGSFTYAGPDGLSAAMRLFKESDPGGTFLLKHRTDASSVHFQVRAYAPVSMWLPTMGVLKQLAESAVAGQVDASFFGDTEERCRIHFGGGEEQTLPPPDPPRPPGVQSPPPNRLEDWYSTTLPDGMDPAAIRELLWTRMARAGLGTTSSEILVCGHNELPDVVLAQRGRVLVFRAFLPPDENAKRILRLVRPLLRKQGLTLMPAAKP